MCTKYTLIMLLLCQVYTNKYLFYCLKLIVLADKKLLGSYYMGMSIAFICCLYFAGKMIAFTNPSSFIFLQIL